MATSADSPTETSDPDPAPGDYAPLLDEHRAEILGEDARGSDERRPAESDD